MYVNYEVEGFGASRPDRTAPTKSRRNAGTSGASLEFENALSLSSATKAGNSSRRSASRSDRDRCQERSEGRIWIFDSEYGCPCATARRNFLRRLLQAP